MICIFKGSGLICSLYYINISKIPGFPYFFCWRQVITVFTREYSICILTCTWKYHFYASKKPNKMYFFNKSVMLLNLLTVLVIFSKSPRSVHFIMFGCFLPQFLLYFSLFSDFLQFFPILIRTYSIWNKQNVSNNRLFERIWL